MITLTASEARVNLYRLMDHAAKSHQPIHIARKRKTRFFSPQRTGKPFKRRCIFCPFSGWASSSRKASRTSWQECQGTRMVTWQVIFSRHAEKDAQKLASAGLKPRAQELLAVLANDPFQNSSFYEKPFGDLVGAYSWRINIQHRLIYEVFVKERTARLLRMWSHFRLKAALISNRAEHSPHQLPSDATCIAPGFSA